jgi:DNA polymerase
MKKNYVPGEGAIEPDVMFIGEGPGETEDQFGRPFVGKAGQLLDKIIEKMGYSREQVFIGNIVKCRPPANRDPQKNEVEACLPYLIRQIEVIKPRIIVCLGRVALMHLLGQTSSISSERGKLFYFKGIPVIPTYHPAYILRQNTQESIAKAKWETWRDMEKVLELLGKT